MRLYNDLEVSLVVFMPNISTNHAITDTYHYYNYYYTSTWEISGIWLA